MRFIDRVNRGTENYYFHLITAHFKTFFVIALIIDVYIICYIIYGKILDIVKLNFLSIIAFIQSVL